MNRKIIAQDEEIVIGVDVSDRKHNAAVVRVKGGELIQDDEITPCRASWEKFLRKLPGCDLTIVYESGPHGYSLYDLMAALGIRAAVIAPVKHLGGVKTDKRDARSIARDWLARRVRVVSAPEFWKRAARQVLRKRAQYVRDLVRVRNRTSAIGRFFDLIGQLAPRRTAEEVADVNFCIDLDDTYAKFLIEQIKECNARLDEIANRPHLKPTVEKLTRIQGIGTLTALEIALEVADIGKFDNSARFASYTGLCPGEWSSGESRRQGHITRRGPGSLRGALVRSSWTLVRCNKEEGKRFDALAKRIGRKRAIVATARRLAVTIWWTLTESEEKAA